MSSKTSKGPFRLLLKSKSTTETQNGKSKKKGGSSAIHPLAGQQDLLRQQYQSAGNVKTVRGPKEDSIDDRDISQDDEIREEEAAARQAADDDIDTMSVTKGWFAASLRDDESMFSRNSPSEFEFEGQSSLYASVQEIFNRQQQQDLEERGTLPISDTKQTITPTSSSLDKGEGSSSLSDSAIRSSSSSSSNQESGIFRRLKRISRRERIDGSHDEEREEDLDATYTLDDAEDATSPLRKKRSSLTVDEIRGTNKDSKVSLKEAVLERLPKVERPRRSRIQSVQPSLVDDASIREVPSRPDSPEKDSDEDEIIERLKRQSIHSEYGVVDIMEDAGSNDSSDPSGSYLATQRLRIADVDEFDENQFMDLELTTPREDSLYEADESEAGDTLPTLSASRSRERGIKESSDLPVGEDTDEEEEGAATPKALAEDTQASYFEVPSSGAPSVTSANRSVYSMATVSTTTPTKEAIPKIYIWYPSSKLNTQQRYYFLHHLTSRELIWEFERLFLLTSSSKLFVPSSTTAMPSTDVGYFKTQAKAITPNLPFMRFLFTNFLCTCPLFGPAQPIEGAAAIRARKAGAKTFVDQALLPLLRFKQMNCLASNVDINGEWPGEMIDPPSITGVMMGSIIRILTRYFMRLTPDQSCSPWNWSSIPVPSSAAYLDHRVAPNKLKQGGMEVNIAGTRMRSSSKECEMLISVRKYGFPANYVVRTESDFYDYARRLAEEIGRRIRIRPVPPPAGQEAPPPSFRSYDAFDERDEEIDGEGSKKISQREIVFTPPNTGSSQSSIRSFNSSSKRPIQGRAQSNESLYEMTKRNHSSTSFTSSNSSSTRPSEQNSTSSTANTSGLASPKGMSQSSTGSPSPRFFYRSNKAAGGGGGGTSEVNTSQSSLGHTSASHGSQGLANAESITSSTIQSTEQNPGQEDVVEMRRKQLRTWLRDALSIRNAGHAEETKQFLGNGAFLEKEVKSATRKDILKRLEIDTRTIQERENSTVNAPDEIIHLQKEIESLWKNCIEGNGLMEAFNAVKEYHTFSSLPLPFQRAISWANLQVAQFLHHVFLNSHEANENFHRFTELMQCIPWKVLSIALREPTGLMIQKVKASFMEKESIKKLLGLYLGDVPMKKMELEIASLKKRLGKTIIRKLQTYVESADWQKRVIQKASKRNNIPLVAAIVRGDDKPLLAVEGIKRIVAATKVYQEFMNTLPTMEEKQSKVRANVEVRLIVDMQRALKLLCLKRNGEKIRNGFMNELKDPISAFLEPLISLLKRLHRSKLLNRSSNDDDEMEREVGGSSSESIGREDVVMQLRKFVFKLLDVLSGLQVRVQDPWRSLSTLTLFLDDVIPSWYRLLHRFAKMDGLLLDLVHWFKSILSLLKNDSITTLDKGIAKYWQPPKGGLTFSDLHCINEYTSIAKKEKIPQMEAACRWAAGDIDADHSIQLIGEKVEKVD